MGLFYSKSYGPVDSNQPTNPIGGFGIGAIILVLVVIFVIYLLYNMVTQNRTYGNTSVYAIPIIFPIF